MLISEAKPGDIVRFAVANLSVAYNGYHVGVPITATVLARPGYPWGSCYAVGWTAEQDVQRQKEIDYIRPMNDPALPHLTQGIYVMPDTPCEVLTPPVLDKKVTEKMTTKKVYKTLADMKIGDRVKIPMLNRGFTVDSANLSTDDHLVVTVCTPASGGGAVIGWTDAEHKKKNPNTGDAFPRYKYLLDVESQKKFEKSNLTHGYHINCSVPCELIAKTNKSKPKSVGLMLAMIGTGAGLSRLATRGAKSKLREIVAKS